MKNKPKKVSLRAILNAQQKLILKSIEKLPVYLVDARFNPDDKPKWTKTISLKEVRSLLKETEGLIKSD